MDAYSIGLHRRLYEALVQVKPFTIIRDYNRDAFLDFYNGVKQHGNFGINIHRAESVGITKLIDKYSAGCQVLQNAEDFNELMQLCRRHRSLYGNLFTYTLVDFKAISRVTWRKIIAATTAMTAIVLGWIFFSYDD